MKRRDFLGATAAGLVAFRFPSLAGRRPGMADERLVERWSWVMGQTVHLTLFASSDDAGYEAASAVFAELRRVEARLSVFDDASDLSELNRHAGRGPMRVDTDLLAVLTAAAGFRRSTGGAFDIGVEPLMRAWGFRTPRATMPSRSEVAEAEAAVRATSVVIDGSSVRLGAAHTRLDPGGIGVGYGLDRAAAVLRRHGIRRALVDISGDCYALGAPPGGDGWKVEIVDSEAPGHRPRVVTLRDAALATSANTVSVVRVGNRVAGHVMDPATGYPAVALRQASVMARSGMAADALSTAMLVTGRAPAGVRAHGHASA
jgi:FAD:protein FMN transferase